MLNPVLLAEGDGGIDASRVAIVSAHPDDETLACGGLMQRMRGGLTLVCLSDGAPRARDDFAGAGFASNADYSACRVRELAAAVAMVGPGDTEIIRMGLWDQEVGRHLVETSRALAEMFTARGIDCVLTHAFEGGHPDHDAAAFCVWAAAALMAPRPLMIYEFPLYHQGPQGMAGQSFCDGEAGIVVPLSLAERKAKNRALKAYASQRGVLRGVHLASERFRIAPRHDFAALPNGGAVLYAGAGMAFGPEDWVAAARGALATLGLVCGV